MSYEVSKSEKTGKFRYLFRHPETGKVSMMSQGSWNDLDHAIDEADLMVRAIVERTDHGQALTVRNRELEREISIEHDRVAAHEIRLENEKSLSHDLGNRLEKARGYRGIFALLAILSILANLYQLGL